MSFIRGIGSAKYMGCRRPPHRIRSRPRSVWQRASQTLFFDYEDEDEKQSNRHFRLIRHQDTKTQR